MNKSHENLLPKFPISLEAATSQVIISITPNFVTLIYIIITITSSDTNTNTIFLQGLLPPLQPSEDFKLALTSYQAEINHLRRLPSSDQFEEEQRSGGDESDKEEETLKEEKENQQEEVRVGSAGPASPFSMLQAKLEQMPRGPVLFPGGHNFMGSHGPENPLQMMASITNNLVSQPLPNPRYTGSPESFEEEI